MKTTAWTVPALVICACYALSPILIHSEFFSGGWDLAIHLYHTFQTSSGVAEGNLYPRWLPLSNGGYGSPITIFYAPLFYLLTGAVNLFIPSFIVSVKVTTFLGFFLSGVAMYVFLRNMCGPLGSLAGGIAYQLLPYHFFDFYIRETLCETFAFFWLPLILHFAYKGSRENRISPWIGMACSYAGLVLSHLVSAYLFSFVIAAYIVFLSLRRGGSVLLKGMSASFFGLALSAIYFLPMFFERKFVHIGWLKVGPWSTYDHNFLYLKENSQNPFYVQLEQIVLLYMLLLVVFLALNYFQKKTLRDSPDRGQVLFFVAVFVFSLFLSTSPSQPFWEAIPGLPTIVFPWRWLMIATLAVAAVIGNSIDAFSVNDLRKDRRTMVLTAVFHALLIGNLFLSSRYMTIMEPMRQGELAQVLTDGAEQIEFRPVWLADTERDFSAERGKPPVVFKEGRGAVEILDWKSQSRLFRVKAATAATLRIATFFYPGWTAVMNGAEVAPGIEQGSGAMLLHLPPGEQRVSLEFRDTPLRRTAKWISLLSFFGAVTGVVVERRKLKNDRMDAGNGTYLS